VNPHDTLKIKGIQAVQEYWSTRSRSLPAPGRPIDDKHIEVIVRQMLQRSGSRTRATRTSRRRAGRQGPASDRAEARGIRGGQPATYQPLLLGITKASL